MVLPLIEIVARTVFSTGVPGAGPFTNHLTMWVAMLGAAIAARQRLLALATGSLSRKVDGVTRPVAAAAIGSAITALFATGSMEYVRVR
jgi:TRAP-type C4-dicarboxylate transport system permease small subunit